jgi:hypothetical protein
VVSIDTKDACDAAIASRDWGPVDQAIRTQCEERLRSILSENADATIHYFGAAPIPAAMLLGFLVGSWARVVPRLRHHGSKSWSWPSVDATAGHSELRPARRPEGPPILAEGDVVIRVATSLAVEAQSTREIVPRPLAEFDISVDPVGVDVLRAVDLVESVASEFRALLDAVVQAFPNAQTVHVFAAVPVGLAFHMGTLVSPTMHPNIVTYYFDRKAQPQHIPAITLQVPPADRPALTDADKVVAVSIRGAWAKELTQIGRYARLMKEQVQRLAGASSWIDIVLPPNNKARDDFGARWPLLAGVQDTVLATSRVDMDVRDVASGFDFRDIEKKWLFDDGLLAAIGRRLTNEEDRLRAGRMLLFHEGVHLAAQTVTRHTSNQVGRFPKVLEALDYEADVWAMLNDYAMAKQFGQEDASDVRGFMFRAIGTATETFWAFDAGNGPLRTIQVRRMNRYLLWYWQQLRLEHAKGADDEVFSILAERPLIELAGPEIRTRGERVWYSLDPRDVVNLELGVLHKAALHRHAAGPAADLTQVIDGFRNRDGELVKEGLRGIFAQVVRS